MGLFDNKIFQVGGRYATTLSPPVLACKNCGAVIQPQLDQTQIRCRCGKLYTLMAEGRPVQTLPLG